MKTAVFKQQKNSTLKTDSLSLNNDIAHIQIHSDQYELSSAPKTSTHLSPRFENAIKEKHMHIQMNDSNIINSNNASSVVTKSNEIFS
jgi:hypothetical protein